MISSPEEIQRKLSLPHVQISIGCGVHWSKPFEDWINLDGVENDHTDIVCNWGAIPLPDKCAHHLECGDIFEHVPMYERDKTFKEWFRLLKIGGTIRVGTPNLHRTMVDYANGTLPLKEAIQNLYAWMTTPYEQHYYLYTMETLTKVLEDYGFGNIDFFDSPPQELKDRSMCWWLSCRAVKLKDV